ncbi:MAG: hypothetical protein AMJ90_06870 [candidate division Zixibacteria bacterium SM23_73_2]|nr:MAG: hypothetical protein AMJ90_06870 [candidate division Zixibacteria bacterium SM23_73_2]
MTEQIIKDIEELKQKGIFEEENNIIYLSEIFRQAYLDTAKELGEDHKVEEVVIISLLKTGYKEGCEDKTLKRMYFIIHDYLVALVEKGEPT